MRVKEKVLLKNCYSISDLPFLLLSLFQGMRFTIDRAIEKSGCSLAGKTTG